MTSGQNVYMCLRCTMAFLSDRLSSKRSKASLIDCGTLDVTACNPVNSRHSYSQWKH